MKKFLIVLTICAWLGMIGLIVSIVHQGNFTSYLPIIAYNRPQGVLGWCSVLTIILTILAFVWPKSK